MLLAVPPELPDLGEVTVAAHRPRREDRTQGTIRITAEAIRRSGARTLGELLGRQAGLAIRSYGEPGALATASWRGVGAEGVLVVRDGVRLNDPRLGQADLGSIPLEGLEDIEIRAGGGSGPYGADAAGGVVLLTSARRPVRRLDAGVGTLGEQALGFTVTDRDANGRHGLSMRQMRATNAFPYTRDGRDAGLRTNAGTEQLQGTFDLERTLPGGRLLVQWIGGQFAKGLPGSIRQPSPRASQTDNRWLAALTWDTRDERGLGEEWQLSQQGSETRLADPERVFGPPVSTTGYRSTEARFRKQAGIGAHVLDAGLTTTHHQASRFPDRWQQAAFLEDLWDLGDGWSSVSSVRFEQFAQQGGISPRLGLSWTPGPGVLWRWRSGQTLRAPTLNDLYWPSSPDAAGNPDLRPERTWQDEFGLDWEPDATWDVHLTAFSRVGVDTIIWQPAAGGRWQPANIGRTVGAGLETRLGWRPMPGLSIALHETWSRTLDGGSAGATAGRELPFRPDHVAGGSVTWQPGSDGWGTFRVDHQGRRFSTASETGQLDPATVLGLQLGWQAPDGSVLTLNLDDLADSRPVYQPGYPTPGRSGLLSWSRTY
ncbi:MAG: TonB-dependent receptor [Candidatus Sericytochromatia bacterium]|nr:TonB-dependent receptor [Candidatus Sericytochromatia bacterium]